MQCNTTFTNEQSLLIYTYKTCRINYSFISKSQFTSEHQYKQNLFIKSGALPSSIHCRAHMGLKVILKEYYGARKNK